MKSATCPAVHARFRWSLSNLVALLRMNLFTHRDLWTWLDHPFDGPPTVLLAVQRELIGTAGTVNLIRPARSSSSKCRRNHETGSLAGLNLDSRGDDIKGHSRKSPSLGQPRPAVAARLPHIDIQLDLLTAKAIAFRHCLDQPGEPEACPMPSMKSFGQVSPWWPASDYRLERCFGP